MLGKLVYNLKSPPKMTKAVYRFQSCFKALWNVFEREEVCVIFIRTTVVYLLIYGFADNSRSNFGITFYKMLISALELGLGRLLWKRTLQIGRNLIM